MPHNPQFHHHQQQHGNHSPTPDHNQLPNFRIAGTGAGESLRPPKANPRLLTLILKSIIMLLVISSFFLFLGIAALAVIHLVLLRRPAASRGRKMSPEDLPGFCFAAGSGGEDCAVCLEGCREGDTCRRLPGCCHVFHSRCVDRWLLLVPNCPICRRPVVLEVLSRGSGFRDGESKVLLWPI